MLTGMMQIPYLEVNLVRAARRKVAINGLYAED